jgi:hypothetical protein
MHCKYFIEQGSGFCSPRATIGIVVSANDPHLDDVFAQFWVVKMVCLVLIFIEMTFLPGRRFLQ